MSHMPPAASAAGGNCFEGDETGKKDATGGRGTSSGVGTVGTQSLGMESFAGLTSSLALSGVLSHQQISLSALLHCTLCMPPADTQDFFFSTRLRAFLLISFVSVNTYLFIWQALTHTAGE